MAPTKASASAAALAAAAEALAAGGATVSQKAANTFAYVCASACDGIELPQSGGNDMPQQQWHARTSRSFSWACGDIASGSRGFRFGAAWRRPSRATAPGGDAVRTRSLDHPQCALLPAQRCTVCNGHNISLGRLCCAIHLRRGGPWVMRLCISATARTSRDMRSSSAPAATFSATLCGAPRARNRQLHSFTTAAQATTADSAGAPSRMASKGPGASKLVVSPSATVTRLRAAAVSDCMISAVSCDAAARQVAHALGRVPKVVRLIAALRGALCVSRQRASVCTGQRAPAPQPPAGRAVGAGPGTAPRPARTPAARRSRGLHDLSCPRAAAPATGVAPVRWTVRRVVPQ